jgi:hypothetical protein
MSRSGDGRRAYGSTMAPSAPWHLLDQWAYLNGVQLHFSRSGKPVDNADIEAFNGRLRVECLNTLWFLSMADARDWIERWIREDNEGRPHTALGGLTPRAYAAQANPARKLAWGSDYKHRGKTKRNLAGDGKCRAACWRCGRPTGRAAVRGRSPRLAGSRAAGSRGGSSSRKPRRCHRPWPISRRETRRR